MKQDNKIHSRDVSERAGRHGWRAPWDRSPSLFDCWFAIVRWGWRESELAAPIFGLVLLLAGLWVSCALYFGRG